MLPHKITGTVQYDPYRGSMKSRTDGWCVLNLDTELTRYYRFWLKYERHIILQPPAWDAHISIVRGERIARDKTHLWKKHAGRKISVQYEHVGDYHVEASGRDEVSGQFYVIDVSSPEINEIRQELGLRTTWNYHITFGRLYEYEARKPKR